jgi:hypothetical protein
LGSNPYLEKKKKIGSALKPTCFTNSVGDCKINEAQPVFFFDKNSSQFFQFWEEEKNPFWDSINI